MFVKLTKLDNSPVWLNASFIVTVEPRKGGGSIVVPIGDGLDYDVRERCEDVLAMLENAPIAKVVPIPVSDCLTKTPPDVSPEPERNERVKPNRFENEQKRAIAEGPENESVRPLTATPKATPANPPANPPVEESKVESADTPSEEPKVEAADVPAEEPKVETAEGSAELPAPSPDGEADDAEVKKTARKTHAKAKTAKEPKAATAKKPRTPRAKKPTLDLSQDEVVRLQKMAPGSVNKLKNTLYTQFHVEDPSKTMQALVAHNILSLERDHVVWATPVDKSANN